MMIGSLTDPTLDPILHKAVHEGPCGDINISCRKFLAVIGFAAYS